MTSVTPPVARLERWQYIDIVRRALAEDVGTGDVTTEAIVPADQVARGILLCKQDGVLAGLDVASATFLEVDPKVVIVNRREDGDRVHSGDVIAEVTGSARALLVAERTALNFLQRLSGIATRTRQFVDAATVAASHRAAMATGATLTILDTRKTTPTLRVLEKYAVRAGGGRNHRFGLYDAFLIKDNHVRLAGGVKRAVALARAHRPDVTVEVEAQRLSEVDEAIEAGADVILADNLSVDDIVETVRRTRGRAKVEISGGVTLARVPELAATGAEFASAGALTHSAPAIDISFEIEAL